MMLYGGGTSSSSFARGWAYDVFLSFRGEDTRRSFTGSLYNGLRKRGINVFIDDEKLSRGKEISRALLKAIEESRISIIVFSQNYASSTWCLEELVKILECMKTRGQLVWPVFFNVDPSVVRNQRESFGRAMANHQIRFRNDPGKVQKWKQALFEAANLSGWSFENGYEFELIQRIIDDVSSEIDNTIMHIAEHPVGLEARISEVKSLLDIGPGEDIRVIGIHGFGGIGKTTIARALYNSIANQFEATCFLAEIRDTSNQRQGLAQLQQTLLFDMVGEKTDNLRNIYKGIPIIKKRLCCKKVLLILDDVDKLEQLQALAGGRDWFGLGSVIIITTRDKHLLAAHEVDKTYEVKKLNHDEAFELFTWNAFKRKAPNSGYTEISNRVVLYAEGLPLALKVMGSNLFGKTVDEWQSALEKYERIPNKEVQNVLRVTYDNLEENEKEIFLDIACFFKGETVEYVEKTLKACNFHPKFGIGVLIDRSLIRIDEYNRLRMHDLIQDMGREIVREASPLEPGKRSRLWHHEDVFEVLTESTGTNRIQGMMVDLPDQYMVHLKDDSFRMMKNLKILIVRSGHFFGSPQHLPNNLRLLDWIEYPSSSLPSSFQPKKLVVLNLSRSRFTMQEPFKYLDSLTSMDLSHCEFLTKLPDISGAPNLTELNLDYCTNLAEVHDSAGFLEKLVELRAYGCTKLKVFPRSIRLTSLESLILNWCSSLRKFPAILGKMDNLVSISIEGTGIEELPPSIRNLVGLQELSMTSCLSLKELPESIDMLQNLRNLDLEGCPQLGRFLTKLRELGQSAPTFGNVLSLNLENCGLKDEDLPIIFHCFPKLASLVLSGNDFTTLPSCIEEFPSLELLHLDNCKHLREIPGIPPNLQYINARNCTSLTVESSQLLLSQETFEACQLQVMVPGERVPEWFDHYTKGEYVTFWIRKKFPALILCFALAVEGEMNKSLNFEVRFWINGDEVYELEVSRCFPEMVTDHVWLNDLRTHPSIHRHSLDSYLVTDDWNQLEISCELISEESNVTVSWCGVHVCKQEASMKDILFNDPQLDLDSSIDSEEIDKLKVVEPKSLVRNFIETPKVKAPSVGPRGAQSREEKLQPHRVTKEEPQYSRSNTMVQSKTLRHQVHGSLSDVGLNSITTSHLKYSTPNATVDFIQNQTNLTMDELEMEVFYASLETETSILPLTKDTRIVSEMTNRIPSLETQRAQKTLQEFLNKDFSLLMCPVEHSAMKAILNHLTDLPAEDGMSVEMRSLIIQVSRQFTHWSSDYTDECKKIEAATTKLLKAGELEEGLEANKFHFREVLCLENELCNELACLEERKRELEEQMNDIKDNISALQSARNMAAHRKREMYGEAIILKAQSDELREQVWHLRDEKELAQKVQANIRDEWLKLGEKFNTSLRSVE